MLPFTSLDEASTFLGRNLTAAERLWFDYSANKSDYFLYCHNILLLFLVFSVAPLPLVFVEMMRSAGFEKYKIQPKAQYSVSKIFRCYKDVMKMFVFIVGPLQLASYPSVLVILSDANVPGEGEHKIMSFIRAQRSLPGYNCNTRHCLYGLDADLIMLTLATHEVHFSVLREEVRTEQNGSGGGRFSANTSESDSPSPVKKKKKPYEFVHIWILRQYLELDTKLQDPPQTSRTDPQRGPHYEEQEEELDSKKVVSSKARVLDLERIIDDFVFMCFFAGNDFLPHMPTLEINEGCLDLLLHVYKKHFTELGGYLVDMERVGDPKFGFIKLKRVEKFILLVGAYEEQIFQKRSNLRDSRLRRFLDNYKVHILSDCYGRAKHLT